MEDRLELNILHAIQRLHTDWLDQFMIFITSLSNHSEIWILCAVVLICSKKTRKSGITVCISLIIMFILGNAILKNIFARPRPCWIDPSIKLLIENPKDFSFPSGHTYSSFAAAISIFLYEKKLGIYAIALASMIAFSRMYLFVHFPTDILGGIMMGIITAYFARYITEKIYNQKCLNH